MTAGIRNICHGVRPRVVGAGAADARPQDVIARIVNRARKIREARRNKLNNGKCGERREARFFESIDTGLLHPATRAMGAYQGPLQFEKAAKTSSSCPPYPQTAVAMYARKGY